MANDKTLLHLVEDLMKDMYDAEHQIIEALPLMMESATNPDLKKAFQTHLEQTRKQVQMLEQMAKEMNVDLKGKKCVGMQGLIKEGQEVMKMPLTDQARDAGLIMAAQKGEHYEISGYGTLRNFMRALGHNDHARMCDEIADQEGKTDHLLTDLANSRINKEAVGQQR